MSFPPLTVTLAGQAILKRNSLSHLEQPPHRTPIRPLIRPGRADSAAILHAMKASARSVAYAQVLPASPNPTSTWYPWPTISEQPRTPMLRFPGTCADATSCRARPTVAQRTLSRSASSIVGYSRTPSLSRCDGSRCFRCRRDRKTNRGPSCRVWTTRVTKGPGVTHSFRLFPTVPERIFQPFTTHDDNTIR